MALHKLFNEKTTSSVTVSCLAIEMGKGMVVATPIDIMYHYHGKIPIVPYVASKSTLLLILTLTIHDM